MLERMGHKGRGKKISYKTTCYYTEKGIKCSYFGASVQNNTGTGPCHYLAWGAPRVGGYKE